MANESFLAESVASELIRTTSVPPRSDRRNTTGPPTPHTAGRSAAKHTQSEAESCADGLSFTLRVTGGTALCVGNYLAGQTKSRGEPNVIEVYYFSRLPFLRDRRRTGVRSGIRSGCLVSIIFPKP